MSRLLEDISQKHAASPDVRFKLWTSLRPFPGVYLKGVPPAENIDTNGIDVVIVLLRALRAYGWLCEEPRNEGEEAMCKIVDMDLGWNERKDKQAKKALVEKLFANVTREDVEALTCNNVTDRDLEALIVRNKMFQLLDEKALWRPEDGVPWKWITLGMPYYTKKEFEWTGTTSLQEHMDNLFCIVRGKTGVDSCQRFGKLSEFIYLGYVPSQIRKFKELSTFDLNTMLRVVENGKEYGYKQNTRYHILAIIKISEDGHDDIRVYDKENMEIEEYEGENFKEKLKNRQVIPHWTVETAGDARFTLVYYQLMEPPDWPVDRFTIPYKPVEFHRRKDHVEEGVASSEARSEATSHAAQGGTQNAVPAPTKGPLAKFSAQEAIPEAVPSTIGGSMGPSRPNPRERYKDQVKEYQIVAPVGMSNEDGGFGTNIQPPTGPRAMTQSYGGAPRGRESNRWGGSSIELGKEGSNRSYASSKINRRSGDSYQPDMETQKDAQKIAKKDSAGGSLGGPRGRRRSSVPEDQTSVFDQLSLAAESDNDGGGKMSSTAREKSRIEKQDVNDKQAQSRLDRQIESKWPIEAMDIWDQCLGRVENIGLDTLCEWCRAGCIDSGPFAKGDSAEVQLQKALESLHGYVVPGMRGRLPWNVESCKRVLGEINVWSRKVHRSGGGRVSFSANDYSR